MSTDAEIAQAAAASAAASAHSASDLLSVAISQLTSTNAAAMATVDADPTSIFRTQQDARHKARYMGRWQANTAYQAGDSCTAPDGSSLSRVSSGTSRSTFDGTESSAWLPTLVKVGTLDQAWFGNFLAQKQDIVTDPMNLLYARLATASTSPVRLMFFGSSTTEGYGATTAERNYVNLLTRRFQASYPCGVAAWEPPVVVGQESALPNLPGIHSYNCGVGGTFSNNYVGSTQISQATAMQPHVVFHMIGSNDYRTNLVTPTQTKTNIIAAMAALDGVLTSPAIHVISSTFGAPDQTSPANPWADYVQAMKDAAATHSRAIWVNPSKAFVQAGASGPSAVDPMDMIESALVHPTDRGHSLLAAEIARQLRIPEAIRVPLPDVLDRFRRSTFGSTETGQPYTTAPTGVFVPAGGYLTCTTAGNALVNTGFGDAEVASIVTYSASGRVGIFTKSDSAFNNRIGWFLDPIGGVGGTPALALYLTGFVVYVSPTISGLVAGREYFLSLSVKGTQVVGCLDGKPFGSYTLSSGDLITYGPNTHHGLRCTTTVNAKWRNFSVRSL